MATRYKSAPEVREIARELIEEQSAVLGHLRHQKVVYFWREKAQAKGGKTVLGTASLKSGRDALLALKDGISSEKWTEGKEYSFFVIEIAADEWKHLSHHQRRALIFHELLHCGADDDGEPMLVPHDIEEFHLVPALFGLWKHDVERFATALMSARRPQLLMEMDEGEPVAA